MFQPAQTATGFLVGAVVGLTGVGGGSLMTPLLVLLFGVHPATAVGTDLLHAAVTKAGGTAVHAAKGHVDWRVTGLLASGSLPAALLTLGCLQVVAPGRSESRIITVTLGAALLATAASMLWRARPHRRAKIAADGPARHPAWTILTGAVLGVVVSLTSVGAGALGMTALFLIYPRLRPVRLVASDLAHAVPLTLVAGVGHWFFGHVDWMLLGSLLAGSLPGIYLGSHFSGRLPDALLRVLLAILLLLVGLRLVAT
jgi:uncharacterized membrane protein YfcA